MAAELARTWNHLHKELKDAGDPGEDNDKKKKVAIILEHHMKSLEFHIWLLSAVPDAKTRYEVKKGKHYVSLCNDSNTRVACLGSDTSRLNKLLRCWNETPQGKPDSVTDVGLRPFHCLNAIGSRKFCSS